MQRIDKLFKTIARHHDSLGGSTGGENNHSTQYMSRVYHDSGNEQPHPPTYHNVPSSAQSILDYPPDTFYDPRMMMHSPQPPPYPHTESEYELDPEGYPPLPPPEDDYYGHEYPQDEYHYPEDPY
jgi:hypothetical protein